MIYYINGLFFGNTFLKKVINKRIIGTNVNQLYFNKVETPLSKARISCFGYEMMMVAKI